MNNILDGKTGTLTILLADPHTEEATNTVKKLVKDLTNNHNSTLLYEFISKSYYENLKLNEDKLKSSNLYLGKTPYIEDVCYASREHQKLYNTKYLLIDGLEVIQTKYNYCLGRGDIVSIIIKQLKELAQELNTHIITIAPFGNKESIEENLSVFCKYKTAKDYIDKIIVLDNMYDKCYTDAPVCPQNDFNYLRQ